MFDINQFQSQVIIKNDLPMGEFDSNSHFLLYDKALKNLKNPELDEFIDQFEYQLGVPGGEDLKSLKNFAKWMETIFELWPTPASRSQTLVVLGGGSVGDFGGFVASILKRGVGLIQIPSTWLSAMDSSHGGKNALNVAGVKNQIGTIYPAKKVFVVRSLLESNPPELLEQAWGELIKMGLVGDSKFFKEIIHEKRSAQDFSWRFMKFCIEDKYQILLQDPYETQGIRQILNFGHSLGHVFESHFSWSHGDSVLQGIHFALEWSVEKSYLSQQLYNEIYKTIVDKFDRVQAHKLDWYKAPSEKTFRKLLQSDKKMTGDGELTFVFLKNFGQPVLEPVLVDNVLAEAKRQSWIK